MSLLPTEIYDTVVLDSFTRDRGYRIQLFRLVDKLNRFGCPIPQLGVRYATAHRKKSSLYHAGR